MVSNTINKVIIFNDDLQKETNIYYMFDVCFSEIDKTLKILVNFEFN